MSLPSVFSLLWAWPDAVRTVFSTRLPTQSAQTPILRDEVRSTRWFARDELDALPGSAQWLPLLDRFLGD